MKHILWEAEGENLHYYKANLHCHTTVSDGKLTPEEVKKVYMDHGYSAIAYTDHEIFLPHNDLTDENFVALNASEYEIIPVPRGREDLKKTNPVCHFCLIAKKPDIDTAPIYTDSSSFWGNAKEYIDRVKFTEKEKPFIPVYSGKAISANFREARDAGFFVTYNHPDWSGEGYEIYSKYDGMNALEIINGSCLKSGYTGNVEVYTEMLRMGKRIYCISADDNHNKRPFDHPKTDSFQGWVKIAAPSLTYENLTDALENGKFFSGTGDETHVSPDFLSIVYDDAENTVTVKTTDARFIFFRGMDANRNCLSEKAADGTVVTEATFKIPSYCRVFQIVAKSWVGDQSFTNAFYLDD